MCSLTRMISSSTGIFALILSKQQVAKPLSLSVSMPPFISSPHMFYFLNAHLMLGEFIDDWSLSFCFHFFFFLWSHTQQFTSIWGCHQLRSVLWGLLFCAPIFRGNIFSIMMSCLWDSLPYAWPALRVKEKYYYCFLDFVDLVGLALC